MATTTIEIGSASIDVTGYAIQVMPIVAESIDVGVSPSGGVFSGGTGVNRDNDVTWWASANNNRGIVQIGLTLGGVALNKTVFTDTSIDIGVMLYGDYIEDVLVLESNIDIGVGLYADDHTSNGRANFVSWSKIGEASFVIDRSNEAGYRPMDWEGWALQVLPLEEMCVVYGDNGICMMYPVESPAASFGFKNIGKVGIKSTYSVGGSEHLHYFITTNGELWRLTKQGPEKLGYKEFLAPLVNPVLTYDELEERLFIADNATGYVFKDGLGGGCPCMTSVSGGHYIGPDSLGGGPIEIVTDIVDLGHRGIKTITFVEVGIDTTEALYVSVDFRYDKSEDWRESDWVVANPEGAARIQVSGIEFRIRVKQLVFDEVRIDYINVRHQRPDKRFLRGPIHTQVEQEES